MRLSKKQMIIAVMTIVVCIVVALTTYMIVFKKNSEVVEISGNLDTSDMQHFGNDYETCRQNISAHIKNINEKYGELFRAERQKDMDEILKSGKLNNPRDMEIFNKFINGIDECEKNNILWDVDEDFVSETFSRCMVTYGFSIDIDKSNNVQYVDENGNSIGIILEYGCLGPKVPNSEIYNKIAYTNAERYLYKFFEGRIGEKELSETIREVKEADGWKEVVKTYNGIEYRFEYWKGPEELRIEFS